MGQQCSFAKDVYSPPTSPTGDTRSVKTVSYNYNRAQTTLRELFGAIRTGLVVSEAEFNVLPPAIATSARVKLTLGSGSIINVTTTDEAANSAEVAEESEAADAENEEEVDDNEDGEEEDKGPFVLVTTLNGPSWAQGLKMSLSVRPVVGPFAHRKLLLSWSGDNELRVEGSEAGELNPRTIPDSFEDETDFCKCCLLLAYHTDTSTRFNPALEEAASADKRPEEIAPLVIPLKMTAYHTLIANLDAIPQNARLPTKVYHLLYGSQGPVDMTIRAWPDTHAEMFGETPKMRVKSGILFAEFVCLLRARFHLPQSYSIKLYHNHMPILYSDLVASKHTVLDCFIVERSEDLMGSYCSGLDEAGEGEGDPATLVVSLVGYETQNITADLDTKMSDFDRLLRQRFDLKEDSFLLVSAEDDYTPQYCSYDNWKCVYSFAIPDTSFRAGLRRSFRRLSFTRRRSSSNGALQRQLPQEQINAALLPHLDRVLELLSSNSRHFPSNLDKSDFSMDQLYQTMPIYERTLDQCSIHPFTVIQVFEVTGPSIPVTFRVVSSRDNSHQATSVSSSRPHDIGGSKTPGEKLAAAGTSSRTRLTNIMDINPSWPLSTFLRYVDAIVSPGSTVTRHRRLAMGERSLENWEDEADITLGQLLSQWSPAWWPSEGEERKTLTIKDINPSEFLVIEKF